MENDWSNLRVRGSSEYIKKAINTWLKSCCRRRSTFVGVLTSTKAPEFGELSLELSRFPSQFRVRD